MYAKLDFYIIISSLVDILIYEITIKKPAVIVEVCPHLCVLACD